MAVLDISNDNYLIPESLGIQDFPTFKMYDHERLKPAKDGLAPLTGHTTDTFVQWVKRHVGINKPTMEKLTCD